MLIKRSVSLYFETDAGFVDKLARGEPEIAKGYRRISYSLDNK